jgi:hypothetical protein
MTFFEAVMEREQADPLKCVYGIAINDFTGIGGVSWYEDEDSLKLFLREIWGPEVIEQEVPENHYELLKRETNCGGIPREIDGIKTETHEWRIAWVGTFAELLKGNNQFELDTRERFHRLNSEEEEEGNADPIIDEQIPDFIEFLKHVE